MYATNKKQQFSFIDLLIYLFVSAPHVSGDKFAHLQEHFFDCIYSFWYNAPILLPTGDKVEMELHLSPVACCILLIAYIVVPMMHGLSRTSKSTRIELEDTIT